MTRLPLVRSGLPALLVFFCPMLLAAQTIDFGQVAYSTWKDTVAVVTNPLPTPISVTATTIRHSPSEFSIIAGGAPFTVPAGGQKLIGLRFLAMGSSGIALDTLDVTSTIGSVSVELMAERTPLPVELVSFTAEASEEIVLLTWSTATETNNYGFELQRRVFTDGGRELQPFAPVGFVPGHGSTLTAQHYEFVDALPAGFCAAGSMLVYRLRQIDMDGRSEFSPERELRIASASTHALSAYPNPFTRELTVAGAVAGARARLVDACGRTLWTSGGLLPQAGAWRIPAESLRAGMYFVLVESAEATSVIPVLRIGTE